MTLNLILGTLGDDYVLGTDADDLFLSRDGRDDLFGGLGNDRYFSGRGADTVMDFDGTSLMSGGSGNDFLASGNLDDTLFGGAGDDLLSGGAGANILHGGKGNDVLSTNGDTPGDASFLFGGAGNDHVAIGAVSGGSAQGGSGIDMVMFSWAETAMDISLHLTGKNRGITSDLGTSDFAGFEKVEAYTGAGDDTVTGGAYRDLINLGAGNNTAKGHGGNDVLIFQAGGVNRIDGGDGIDVLNASLQSGGWNLVVTGLTGTTSFGDSLTHIERWQITGGTGADRVSLGARGDFFAGRGGDDRGLGLGGDDFLYGGKGDDTLLGGKGDDQLSGGDGQDSLTGGAGADRFYFTTSGDLGDLVTDFTAGQDSIEIAARLIGKALPKGAVDAAAFHLDAALGDSAQFILRAMGSGAELVFDVNGTDAGGETTIALFANNPALTAEDLLIL